MEDSMLESFLYTLSLYGFIMAFAWGYAALSSEK